MPVSHSNLFRLSRNHGALAGLIVGVIVALAAISTYAWFTWKRHRLRQKEAESEKIDVEGPPFVPTARRASRRSILDDDRSLTAAETSQGHGGALPDLDFGSSVGHVTSWNVYRERGGDGNVEGFSPYSPFVSEESTNLGNGPASSNGHGASSHGHSHASSHGHNTILSSITPALVRTQSPPSAWPGERSVTPHHISSAMSGSNMNSPDPRAPSRSSSVDSNMGHWMTVTTDPDTRLDSAYNLDHTSPIYQSPDTLPHDSLYTYATTSHTLISQPSAVLNPPSSLLRPPSTTITPTDTLRERPSKRSSLGPQLYLQPALNNLFMAENPSPAISDTSVAWGREGLLNPPAPLGGAAISTASLHDEVDYTRRIGGVSVNYLLFTA